MNSRNRSLLVLGACIAALCSGRAIIALLPDLPADPTAQWRASPSFGDVHDYADYSLRFDLPRPRALQFTTFNVPGGTLRFFRYAYTSDRIDSDLVPWMPRTFWMDWVPVSRRIGRMAPATNLVIAENPGGNRTIALAYVFRIGSHVTPDYRLAKLMQVPAKIAGENIFELIGVTAECDVTCEQAEARAEAALVELVRLNVPSVGAR